MHKPGEIVYARPGFAVMTLGDDEYLFGDQVVRVPYEVMEKALECGELQHVPKSIGHIYSKVLGQEKTSLPCLSTEEECAAFAFAMMCLPQDDVTKTYSIFQDNVSLSFRIHRYTKQFIPLIFQDHYEAKVAQLRNDLILGCYPDAESEVVMFDPFENKIVMPDSNLADKFKNI